MFECILVGNTQLTEFIDDVLVKELFVKSRYKQTKKVFRDSKRNTIKYVEEYRVHSNAYSIDINVEKNAERYLIYQERPNISSSKDVLCCRFEKAFILETNNDFNSANTFCGFESEGEAQNFDLTRYSLQNTFVEISGNEDDDILFVKAFTVSEDVKSGESAVKGLKSLLKNFLELRKPQISWILHLN